MSTSEAGWEPPGLPPGLPDPAVLARMRRVLRALPQPPLSPQPATAPAAPGGVGFFGRGSAAVRRAAHAHSAGRLGIGRFRGPCVFLSGGSQAAVFVSPSAPGPVPVLDPADARPEPAALNLSSQEFDVETNRRDFPILRERVNGHPLIWLDNAATTQKPQSVIDRLSYYYAPREFQRPPRGA